MKELYYSASNMFMVVVKLVLLLVLPLLISASTYYVKPTDSSSCSNYKPCHTLEQYAQKSFNSDTALIFLPGDHSLDIPVRVENVRNFTLKSLKEPRSPLKHPSRVVCNHNTSNTSGYFYFNDVHDLHIESLVFFHCGGASEYSITLSLVDNFHLINCVIEGGVYPGLAFNGSNGLHITGNVFANNTCANSLPCKGGAIWAVQGYWNFTQNNFSNNSGFEGGGISAENCVMDFSSDNFFRNNSASSGGAIYVNGSLLNFISNVRFVENSADPHFGFGGAIHAFANSEIYFGGNSIFEGNTAMRGGGLELAGGSKCYFHHNTEVKFTGNYAAYGGAIHVSDTNQLGYCPQAHVKEACFFQILDQDVRFGLSSKLCLANNSATLAGDALFGGVIDNCQREPYPADYPDDYDSGEVFDLLVMIEEDFETSSDISSPPLRVCMCANDTPLCNTTSHNVSVYPGETVVINLAAVGQRNGTVPANLLQSFESGMDFGDHVQVRGCTDSHYTMFTAVDQSSENVKLYPQGPCSDLESSLELLVHFRDCPPGFVLSNLTKSCVCADRLQKYTNDCNITSQMILRSVSDDFWVGYDSSSEGLILHPHCPFDYCKSRTVTFTLNDTDLECDHNRSGLLCGGCQPGLSLTLGSPRCRRCSNAYLALLLPFALAGFVLVVLLFAWKLTVTIGDINGLIFYANIVAANRAIFFPAGDTNVLTLFVAWINLDFGIETCFYDGMDAYARTWLQVVFPLYVWIILGFIILLRKYTTFTQRVLLDSNPVAILATLFLLSYTKILRVIFAALSSTTLDYPSDRTVAVWLYDGSIKYLHGKHVLLFLAAIFLFLFVILPYTLLLLLGQCIQSKSDLRCLSWVNSPLLQSLLDAYHAPYRNGCRYWTGLLLLVRCALLLAFTINSLNDASINLLMISTAAFSLQLWAWMMGGKLYQKWYHDALEGSFYINLGLLAVATYHVKLAGGSQAAVTYISVSVAFITFVGIILYHTILQLKGQSKKCLKRNTATNSKTTCSVNNMDITDGDSDSIPLAARAFYYGAYAGFREPLLDT